LHKDKKFAGKEITLPLKIPEINLISGGFKIFSPELFMNCGRLFQAVNDHLSAVKRKRLQTI
jgi:hypothetical protein